MILDILFNPLKFFGRLKQPPLPWGLVASIYAASLLAASAFYAFKPMGFPEGSLSADMEPHSFLFWLGIGLVGAVLTVILSAMIYYLLRFLSASSVTLAQVLLINFSSHLFYLLLSAMLFLATLLRQETLYKTTELFFSLAGFVFTVRGIRFVAHVTIAKAFLAILVSSLVMLAAVLGLGFAGIIPLNFLKALILI